MQLKNLTLTNKAVIFSALFNPNSESEVANEEERKVTAKEVPLPELTLAFDKLKPVFCEILALPKDYAAELAITSVSVSVTKHGTRAVAIRGKKNLDTIGGNPHTIDTPFVKIDKPQAGESGEMQVSKKSSELIKAALHECERYASGERSQQVLDFDKAKGALQATADQGADDMFAEA